MFDVIPVARRVRTTIASSIVYSTTPRLRPTVFKSSPRFTGDTVRPGSSGRNQKPTGGRFRRPSGQSSPWPELPTRWPKSYAQRHLSPISWLPVAASFPDCYRARRERLFLRFRRGLMTARLFSRFFLCVFLVSIATATTVPAQELGGAGTVQGTVKDPTGAVMVAATVTLTNPITGLRRETTTDQMGRFVVRNLPPNPYHVAVSAQGFETLGQDVDVRTAIPINLDLNVKLAGTTQTVEVVGHSDLLEADPTAHTDIDQTLVDKLPIEATGGLNQVITMASPGVVADSNGFFHPVGDHAQTQFSIDNQPITDQQSRIYLNQISQDAVQSMEIITGVAPAEYGDKSSLVVHIVTKSGLDQPKPAGSASFEYGSFKSPLGEVNVGGGNHKVGDFLSFSGLRTDRFLDPPEF